MFDLQFSNRFEQLSTLLSDRLDRNSGAVFEQQVVLVASVAMRRRLTLELASRHGICANLRFAYPAQWLWEQVAAFNPDVLSRSPFDPATLAWHAVAAFSDPGWYGQFPRLAAYLDGADDLMALQLAQQVAALFSHYVTYRSDWLEAWQRGETAQPATELGEDEPWQASLWRRIAALLGLGDRNPLLEFARQLEQGVPGPLPTSVHAFCLPDIAPMHLQVFRALGSRCDLNVYALNPCAEYWFDVVDRRRLSYLRAQGTLDFHETGNRLLAGWARQSRSQLGLLVDKLEAQVDEASFEPSGSDSLLGQLQDSILMLHDLDPGSVVLADEDRSIEFHECHSHSRELEVLHDRLLGLFEKHSDLQPGEVLVVVPDLKASAPLIDAVFGTVARDRAIPYLITGLGREQVNPVARAFMQLLTVARSRWTANEVVGLLEMAPIGTRFGLDATAISRVRDWLQDAGVRWGLNASHRQSLDLPATAARSFDDGLERLYLGYALPDSIDEPFDGRMPAGFPEGSEAGWLGAAWHFVDELARLRLQMSEPRSPAQWALVLADVQQRFCDDGGAHEHAQELHAAIRRFASQSEQALAGLSISAELVQAALTGALEDPERGGVPSGSVTFASISSLRALPYRVVCMLGFDDGAFPAISRAAEFDLMAANPRTGDRQRQADDRNLFLDQILAARQYLHLSYVGRGIRDNAPYPPSVLVSELLEYLVAATAQEPAAPESLDHAQRRLLVRQPLQPFSRRAFDPDADPRVASHNAEFARALLAREEQAPGNALPVPTSVDQASHADDDDEFIAVDASIPFFREPLAEPDETWGLVSLKSLESFFRNPCRYLLERRLGIALPRDEEQLEDDEAFLIGWNERDAISARLFRQLVDGLEPAHARRLALAGTDVPPGSIGVEQLESTLADLHALAARIRPMLAGDPLPAFEHSLMLELQGRAWRLDASFSDLRADGLVRYRDRDAGAGDYLSAWLHHLVLCAASPVGVQARVCWIHRNTQFGFRVVDQPRQLLGQLLALYAQGLCFPVYFFPRSAWSYARSGWEPEKAIAGWRATEYQPKAEQADPFYQLALRGLDDPMGQGFGEFDRCARQVFEPLLEHLVELES